MFLHTGTCFLDECLLLKVYQGCLGDTEDLPNQHKICMQLKVRFDRYLHLLTDYIGIL
jgi:hypothetical protein